MLPPSSRRAASLLPIALLVAVTLPAQAPPEPWRLLRAMQVEGLDAWQRDDVAAALVVDADTMRALQRGLDAEAAGVVAERVQELHRRGGYPQAVARGEVVGDVLRVHVSTGSRLRCGPVQVAGDASFPLEGLRKRLAGEEPAEASWRVGGPPRLGPLVVRRIEAAVREVASEAGRQGLQADVTFEPVGDELRLQVAVRDPGREVRIQRVQLEGEAAEHHDAVLATLDLLPGAVATAPVLAALRRQLEATARYARVECTLPSPPPAVLDPLVVRVTLRPGAPAPGAVPAADEAQLRAALDRAAAHLEAGHAVRCRLDSAEQVGGRGFRLPPGQVTLVVGRQGLLLDVGRVAIGDAAPAPLSLRVRGDEALLRWGPRVGRWRFPGGFGLSFQLQSGFNEDGSAQMRWGVGFSTRAGHSFEVDVHPGIATHLLTRPGSLRREGEQLVFGDDRTEYCRIAADGTLVDGIVTVPAGGDGSLTIELPTGAALDTALHLPDEAALAALPAAATPFGALAGLLDDALASAGDERTAALLRGLDAALLALPAAPPAGESERLPSLVDVPPRAMLGALGSVLATVGVRRSWNGWPVPFAATFAALLAGDTRTAGASLRAFLADESHGPVALASAAVVLDVLGNEAMADRLRATAAERWSLAAVRTDLAALAANAPRLLPSVAAVAAGWRAEPQLHELFAGLPAGGDGDAAVFERGCSHLWSAGGEAWLRRLLLRQ